ncbi:polyketide synthase (OzmK) [Streptomyces qinglanensis]|uniref:Polyketide synthase (OzmK) n=1 Tax=Streptomyces qinglanensis TaxID=943816 RepID=A0A1E7K8M1_9ACTN|nr:beta-ketoacyl synthase N-terminal-like domain-containing protein [Streptomyces qinglanensis]OEV00244.1 polyketide synthase (OzmK) [Streptomyces qinglanensis]
MSEIVRVVEEAAAKLNLTTVAGLDLARSVSLVEAINTELGTNLSSGVVADHPDIGRLAAHVESVLAAQGPQEEVAIVGLHCRTGGAAGPEEFWDLVREGRDVTREIDDPVAVRMFQEAFPGAALPRYGAMPDTDAFDPGFFRIAPTEAAAMDAAQRVLLESSYHALEDAAIDAATLRGQRVGTVVGTTGLAPQAEYNAHSLLGSDTSVMVSRLAYHLDLAGPALAMDTACSSSLVALDLAARLLLSDEADLVLAGGVYTANHPGVFLTMQSLGTVSGTRRCRPFDAAADGMLVGEGVGMLVLKRLSDALRDNDRVHGVIRASGTNQDGRTSGITAPSTQAQAGLLRGVLNRSGVAAEDLGYFEAHGTGTTLGDPIEIAGITSAFDGLTDRTGYCPIGSVKANIGHTMGAAGVLGVIKVLLSMRAGVVPPAANFSTPSPHIDFSAAPVRVATEESGWAPGADGRRHAAVSSFGYSGTNAHLVLSDLPAPARPQAARPGRHLVPLSARSEERLRAKAAELATALRGPLAGADLADVAYTLQVGREAMAQRAAVVADSTAELADRLEGIAAGESAEPQDLAPPLAEAARQWAAGEPVSWARLHLGAAPRRIGLPGYPFERHRYPHVWADGTPIERPTDGSAPMSPAAPSDGARGGGPAQPAEPVQETAPGVPSVLPELDAAAAAHLAEHPDRTSLRAALEAEELADELAALCEQLLLASLRRMGVFAAAGERYTVQELIGRLGVVAEHHRQLAGLVRLLVDAGHLAEDGDGYVTTERCAAATLQWEETEVDRLTGGLLERRPEMAGFAKLLTTCLDAYPDVLTGKRKAHEVLFPDGSFTAVEGVYHSDQDANALVARLVAEYTAARLERDPEVPVAVVEVGAGTGGTTASVLPALSSYSDRVRYTYTDISRGFTRYGADRYGSEHDFLDTAVLDIERPAAAQGFAGGEYDVVLATNVLHATARIDRTLANARSLLRPGGILILLEVTRVQPFPTLTFGLMPGWWSFEDTRLPNGPLLSAPMWRQALERAGLGSVRAYSLLATREDRALESVLLAENAGATDTAAPVEPAVPAAAATATAPAAGRAAAPDGGGAAPATAEGGALEAMVAEAVAEVLGLASVAPADDFHELGGDSILATQVISRLRDHFPIELDLGGLFEAGTVAAMARLVETELVDRIDELPESVVADMLA